MGKSEKKTLADSGIEFNEAAHTYTYKGRTLTGVTPIVRWMYPETYAGINERTLAKAAERGSYIHEQCQMYNTVGITGEAWETQEYIRLLNERGLKPLDGEYLVSDFERLASAVDVVFDDYSLGDIKCTSQIHFECVSLQLNIYRVFFEEMNIVEVPHLYVVWLPRRQYGMAELHELPLWDKDIVYDILAAYGKGGDPAPLRERINRLYSPTVIPQGVLQLSRRVKNIENLIGDLKAQREKLLSETLAAMRQYNVKTWDTGIVRFTRLLPTTRKTVDAGRLKADYPEVYEACLKETETKETIKVTIRQQGY